MLCSEQPPGPKSEMAKFLHMNFRDAPTDVSGLGIYRDYLLFLGVPADMLYMRVCEIQ